MRKVEHIGIAVEDLEKGNALFGMLLNAAPYKVEEVASEQVRTSFFQVGETKIELLESMSTEGPIARFLKKRGPGIHHIAFDVPDIRKAMRRLSDAGYKLLSEEPKPGADGKLVCFVHPKSAGGVLIELCQDIPALDVDTA